LETLDQFKSLIGRAASATTAAAEACRNWENGGDPGPVSNTAWEADEAMREALAVVAGIDPALIIDTSSETRLARLLMAAYLLVLAGTDEGGRSTDLETAVLLLKSAEEE